MRADAATSRGQTRAIDRAISRCRAGFLGVGLFSGLINVLALTSSIYMLQVYDRVIPARSIPTLVGLTVLMLGLYAAYGILDLYRTRLLSRVGVRIDKELREPVFAAVLSLPLKVRPSGDGLQPVRDLEAIRGFFSGLGPTALFDLPWIPLYLALVFLLHPLLGLFATAGAVLLVVLTLLTEARTQAPTKSAAVSSAQRQVFGESARRNAEAVRALGMTGSMQRRWRELNARYLTDQTAAAHAASGLGAFSKVLRMVLQSGILGLGAYLVVKGEATGGVMIAASITMSRALAPIEIAIANWKSFVAARQARQRLAQFFAALPPEAERVALPAPSAKLDVHGLAVAAPGTTRPIIQNVGFSLAAGSGMGIIGPSGSGKSTLTRALVGAWEPLPQRGAVRLDGAALDQWPPDALGRHVGYLPQEVELFDGTIGENIARFDDQATSEAIIAAAQAAGVHDLILQLPNGYDTRLGLEGIALSAGQRQRVALARALYGDPFLVVLDEPNSNLDSAGDAALARAITSVRARGGIVVVVAHRPSALAGLDQLLVLSNGMVSAFGPKEEVLRKTTEIAPAPAAAPAGVASAPRGPAGLKVVGEDGARP